jgi:signal transduction histidine kinase
MRQMLGILRQDDAAVAVTAGLARLDTLVRDARAAGHAVTVDTRGPVDRVPALAALTAHRVVQEAITNTIRHAKGASIAITLDAAGDRLTVVVTDDGNAAEPAPDGGHVDGATYGLVGLRERVEAAGGTLEAGRRTDAPGWRVIARLPVGEEAMA